MNYLGLDISTSTIGYTILDEYSQLVDCGHINLKKEINEYYKCFLFIDFLDQLKEKYTKENLIIYVEEPLKMFSANMSMAQTIGTLQRFNGMACSLILIKLDVQPKLINASAARKLCGIKIQKGIKAKEVVMEYIKKNSLLPEEKWEYKKTGKVKDYLYDICDSYIISLAGLKSETPF